MSEDRQRPPAEDLHADELERLPRTTATRPPGRLAAHARARSSRFVRGDAAARDRAEVRRHAHLVERCVVALATNRGLMLVGGPGTAKSSCPSCWRRRSAATRR